MKKGILIVSFGTSNLQAYKLVEEFIAKIRLYIKEDVYIQYVFTSNILIRRMKEKNNIDILNVNEVLNLLYDIGCRDVLLQPLHMMDGKDCDSLRGSIKSYKDKFDNININPTLLINKENNTRQSALNIVNCIKDNVDKNSNVVLIGHGSNRCSEYCCYTSDQGEKYIISNDSCCNDDCYLEIEKAFTDIGYNKVVIGTLEGRRTKEVVLKELIENQVAKAVIMPLLVLPGNHIIKDIQGDNSWQSFFENNNIKTEVNIKSLLEYEEIQRLYIDMIQEGLQFKNI